jgi:hypothetical protein
VQALNTRLLLFAVVSTTLLQWTVMMAIDWSAESVVFLPGGQKVVVLLFQVVSTRTAGFQTIDYSAARLVCCVVQWLTQATRHVQSHHAAADRSDDVYGVGARHSDAANIHSGR